MSERLQQFAMAGVFSLLAWPVAAEETFSPPKGCDALLTVQLRECRVEHHYRCDAAGSDRFRIVFTDAGPTFLSRIDADAQWLTSMALPEQVVTETVQPVLEPISVKALLETGEHGFDFSERWPDGRVIRAKGWDRIVQRNVMIDGEVLHRTVFGVEYFDEAGTLIETYTGAEYVSETHMRFFSGKGTMETDEGAVSFDRSPKEFVYPGEPGFLSVVPKYDCGMMMSALD